MNQKIPRLNKGDLTGQSALIQRKYQRLFSVIKKNKKTLFGSLGCDLSIRVALLGSLFLIGGVLGFGENVSAATIFLDNGATGCTNGATNYDSNTRSCASGVDTVYDNLGDFSNSLIAGEINYIRAGTYVRTTGSISEGSLYVTASGSASQHTIVSNFNNEQPVICTAVGKCQYNPNPGDTSNRNCYGNPGVGGSACYYPNPAISIAGSFIDVIGFKTYGQALIRGTNITLQNCDLGGGGPYLNQGQVVMIHSSSDILIKNNEIHHSCWGESGVNAAALMGYSFAATIENNEFYDNWGADIRLKDTRNMQGYTTIIRYNFFRPSTMNPGNAGVMGINQYADIDNIYIHNNIFYQKDNALPWDSPGSIETVAYSNTFVDCNDDLNTWFTDTRINVFNNLHYHSVSSQTYLDIQAQNFASLQSDYNLFYSVTGDTSWRNLYSNRGSTLPAWQSYSGKDGNSVSKDPGFVNSAGSNPEDFKRTDYSGDVSGSSYGTVAGAYQTGNETIGLLGSGSSDTTPPIVSITSPTQSQTVSGDTTISASASDNVGVAGVQFKLDGTNLGSEDTTSPYSISWDTTTVSNGLYNLTATARDTAGNNATSTPVTTTVNNGGSSLLWETTFDCSEWSAESGPATIDCDGLSGGGDCHCSGGQYEQITTGANYPGGAGGRGKRHWRGPGKNNNSCSPNFNITPAQNEIWLRWYIRYESGFEWLNDQAHEKIVHLTGNAALRWTGGKIGIYDNANHHQASNNGWLDYIAGADGKGDGTWHCFEVHLNRATGVGQCWIDGVKVLDKTGIVYPADFDHFALPSNAGNVVHIGCKWEDVDDIAISNTGYIGPITTFDTTPPTRSNPQPTGTLSSGITQTTISLDTNETATCKYDTASGVAFDQQQFTFDITGSTSHSQTITNLSDGETKIYYIRCQDEAGNANPDDFEISFSIASSATYSISNFINLVSDWLKSESGLTSDVNGDGIVNTRDLGIMMSNWSD